MHKDITIVDGIWKSILCLRSIHELVFVHNTQDRIHNLVCIGNIRVGSLSIAAFDQPRSTRVWRYSVMPVCKCAGNEPVKPASLWGLFERQLSESFE